MAQRLKRKPKLLVQTEEQRLRIEGARLPKRVHEGGQLGHAAEEAVAAALRDILAERAEKGTAEWQFLEWTRMEDPNDLKGIDYVLQKVKGLWPGFLGIVDLKVDRTKEFDPAPEYEIGRATQYSGVWVKRAVVWVYFSFDMFEEEWAQMAKRVATFILDVVLPALLEASRAKKRVR